MKKTEGITKYEVQWQLIRAGIKGSKTELESKLDQVREYFLETQTYDRYERAFNWLEGLEMGYRGKGRGEAESRIHAEKLWYKSAAFYGTHKLDTDQQMDLLMSAAQKDVVNLWKDLFRTNSKWLQKGYYHEECNNFMDWLWNNRQDIKSDVNYKYSMDWLVELRKHCSQSENKHKFFF